MRDTDNDTKITLIGTNHVSKHSANTVEEEIRAVRPDLVCVELCDSRVDMLDLVGKAESGRSIMDILQYLRPMNNTTRAIVLVLGVPQLVMRKLNRLEEGDMERGIATAQDIGSDWDAIDEDIYETSSDLSELLAPNGIVRALSSFLSGDAEALHTLDKYDQAVEQSDFSSEELHPSNLSRGPNDALFEAHRIMRDTGSDVYRVMVSERNETMTKRLAAHARSDEVESIVCVVGRLHVPGMVERFEDALEPGTVVKIV